MSVSTLIPSADDFREWEHEFGATYTPDDLPEPDFDGHRHAKRRARTNEERTAIDSELGLRRHRTHEREV